MQMIGRAIKRRFFPVILSIAVLAIAYVAYAKAVRTYDHVMAIRWYAHDLAALSGEARLLTDSSTLERVRMELDQVRLEIGGLESETEWLLAAAPYLGWIPFVGPDLASTPKILEMAKHLSLAGGEATGAMRPIVETLDTMAQGTGAGDGLGVRLFPVLVAQRERLASAAEELNRAAAIRREMDASQLSPAFKTWLDRTDRLLPQLRAAVQMALVAPDLLGVSRPRTYLLIAQSNNELRATGGLVSAVGPITLDRGKIVELPFERGVGYYDDLAKRHPPPPAAFFKYMNAGLWFMRDANWSPDFPTTARTIEAFYKLDTGVQVDGVLAFDIVMAPWILEAIGPVEVPEFQERADAGNLLARVESHWASARYTPDEGQKDFMGAVLKAAILKINQGQGIAWPKLLAAIHRGLSEKHLLIYLHDRNLATGLTDNHWDGALYPAQGDYLMVVDSNLGYNKVNANITQTMEYAVDFREPQHPNASITLTYINRSTIPVEQCIRWPPVETTYARAKQGCYWDYLRVYVPQGSRLIGASGLNEPSPILDTPEGGKAIFATFMILSPGERRQVRFEYALPPFVADSSGEYQLYVQKQSGTAAIPLRVQITFPLGTDILSAESNMSRATSETNTLTYDTDLSVDRSLALKLRFPAIRVEFQRSSWLWILIPMLGLVLIAVGLYLRRAAYRSGG